MAEKIFAKNYTYLPDRASLADYDEKCERRAKQELVAKAADEMKKNWQPYLLYFTRKEIEGSEHGRFENTVQIQLHIKEFNRPV